MISVYENPISIFIDKPPGLLQTSDNCQGFSLSSMISGFGVQELLRNELDDPHRSDEFQRHDSSHRMFSGELE